MAVLFALIFESAHALQAAPSAVPDYDRARVPSISGGPNTNRLASKSPVPYADRTAIPSSRPAVHKDAIDTSDKAVLGTSFPITSCSRDYCSLRGSHASCVFVLNHQVRRIFKCSEYARTPHSRSQCSFFCPLICVPEHLKPTGSNGVKFCSICHLRKTSCSSHYFIYGPVRPTPTPKPLNPVQVCSMRHCTAKGAHARCFISSAPHPIFTTCASWANTSAKLKQCEFFCTQICQVHKKPFDNFGKAYCSVCHLQKASCVANFRLYGPVHQ